MVPRTVFQSKETQMTSDSGPVNMTENLSISGRWTSLDDEIDNKTIGVKATVT